MKKSLSLSFVLALSVNLSAATVGVQNGWNLISTAGENNVASECILNQLSQGSMIWKYNSNQWFAKSNDPQINNLIYNHNIEFVNSIGLKEGFWVYNSGDFVDVNMSCLNNEVNFTMNYLLQPGNVFFGVDIVEEGVGYGKFIVNSQDNIKEQDYEFNGTGFNLTYQGDINTTIVSDNNVSYSSLMPDREKGYLILNEVKKVSTLGDLNVSDLGVVSFYFNRYVTQGEEDHWEEENWGPSYNDIESLKNSFIDPNDKYHEFCNDESEGGPFMFEASTDTSITSGNVVKAKLIGISSDGHKEYARTDEVVGSWKLENGILTAITPKEIVKWKIEDGKRYETIDERAGSVWKEVWFMAKDPAKFEERIREYYKEKNSNH